MAVGTLRIFDHIGGNRGVFFTLRCCFCQRVAERDRTRWAEVGTVTTHGTGVMPDDEVIALLRFNTGDVNRTSWADKCTGLAQNTLLFIERDFSFVGIHALTFSFQSAQALMSPSTIV